MWYKYAFYGFKRKLLIKTCQNFEIFQRNYMTDKTRSLTSIATLVFDIFSAEKIPPECSPTLTFKWQHV